MARKRALARWSSFNAQSDIDKMKLFSKPGSCSTAEHILLQWLGEPFEVELMTFETMKSPEFLELNPSGLVPVLVDDDFVLTQNSSILSYLADRHPGAGLAGDGSTRQRAVVTKWLAFVDSDIHPAFIPLFAPGKMLDDETGFDDLKNVARRRLRGYFEQVDERLATSQWLAGFRSIVDPYLYVLIRWAKITGVDIDDLRYVGSFMERMSNDPGVVRALDAEGLSHSVKS